jgi:prolactin regulatory element-binding protein
MRAKHYGHAIPQFPVYSSSFVSDNEVVLGGGGGSAKSGIKNQLARASPHIAHMGID